METCSLEQKSVCREEVFSDIFQKQFRALRNYLFYRFGDSEQVKDTAQEAFTTLWQNCARVSYEEAPAYLYKVAQNKSIKLKLHEKVVLAYEQTEGNRAQNRESPQFILEEKQFKDKLLNAIAKLNEPQRVAFLMHRVDKMKYSEIASALGISVKAVEKRIHIAVKVLRDELKQNKI